MLRALMMGSLLAVFPITEVVGALDAEMAENLEVATPSDAMPSDATPSDATPSDAEEVVSQGGLEELLLWLDAVNDGEGLDSFTLTEDLMWSGLSYYIKQEVTIDTNGHSIIIPSGKSFVMNGPVRFLGGNSEKPVFVVQKGGGLSLHRENILEITNGVGIMLEDLCQTGKGITGCYFDSDFSEITVSGNDAAAIYGKKGLRLKTLNIRAEDGALAVKGDGQVELVLSEIKGEGNLIEAGMGIILDGCFAEPAPENAAIRERETAVLTDLRKNGIYSWPSEVLSSLPTYLEYGFRSEQGVTEKVKVNVTYDWQENSFQEPGIYKIKAIPEPSPVESPLFAFPEGELNLIVMDSSKRYLTQIKYMSGRFAAALAEPKEADEELVLYYSTDQGKNWQIWPLEESNAGKSMRNFRMKGQLDPNVTYWFQADLTKKDQTSEDGTGEATLLHTNIIEVNMSRDGISSSWIEGNRDDSNRDPGAEEPEETKPEKPGSGSWGGSSGGSSVIPVETKPSLQSEESQSGEPQSGAAMEPEEKETPETQESVQGAQGGEGGETGKGEETGEGERSGEGRESREDERSEKGGETVTAEAEVEPEMEPETRETAPAQSETGEIVVSASSQGKQDLMIFAGLFIMLTAISGLLYLRLWWRDRE